MAQSEVVELDVRLEARDYLRANYALLFRETLGPVLIIFTALLLGLYGLSWSASSEVSQWWALVLPGVVLFLSINVLIGMRLSFSSNKALREAMHYSFSDAGITASSASCNSYMDWDNIRRALETRHDFLLFVSRNQTYLIPKRAFRDDQQIASFKSLMRSCLSSRAKLRRGSKDV